MRIVKFTDVYGKEVWVYPDRVCTVREFAAVNTVIAFENPDANVSVKLDLSSVATMLLRA